MADNLSFPLGAEGYNVYKICAYGSVHETIAYLLRRALENSDVLGGATKETVRTYSGFALLTCPSELVRSNLTQALPPGVYR